MRSQHLYYVERYHDTPTKMDRTLIRCEVSMYVCMYVCTDIVYVVCSVSVRLYCAILFSVVLCYVMLFYIF